MEHLQLNQHEVRKIYKAFIAIVDHDDKLMKDSVILRAGGGVSPEKKKKKGGCCK